MQDVGITGEVLRAFKEGLHIIAGQRDTDRTVRIFPLIMSK